MTGTPQATHRRNLSAKNLIRDAVTGRPRATRGFVLVQALLIVAGLLALAAVLAANQRVALNGTQARLRERRAEIAARAGLNVALTALNNANANLLTRTDDWAILGNQGKDAYETGDAATTFRIQIRDAGERININTATEAQLDTLPLTQEQIDSLLDWREAGGTPRPQGAKDDYYNALPRPYNARLAPLATLNELLLIRGWTAKTIFDPSGQGVSAINSTAPPMEDADGNPIALIDALTVESGAPNTRATGAARINVNLRPINAATLIRAGIPATLASQIAARAPITSWNQLLTLPGVTPLTAQTLLDNLTVAPGTRLTGKINVNTAPQTTLENALSLSPDIAAAIVTRQATGLQSLGELGTISGLSGAQLARIADSVTVGGDTWIVRTYGQSGGVGVAAEATIGLRSGRVQILNFQRLNHVGIPTWWHWPIEPTAVSPVTALATVITGANSNAETTGSVQ